MSQVQQKMQDSDPCICSPYLVQIDIILLHRLESRVPVYKSTNKNKQGLTSDSPAAAGNSLVISVVSLAAVAASSGDSGIAAAAQCIG
jgi:hypothetical protein